MADTRDEPNQSPEDGPDIDISLSAPRPDESDDLSADALPEENTSGPAEVAAMHLIDESAGGFDSEVDDPALAAAYEIDPEREH